jgi:hypothetical protein
VTKRAVAWILPTSIELAKRNWGSDMSQAPVTKNLLSGDAAGLAATS